MQGQGFHEDNCILHRHSRTRADRRMHILQRIADQHAISDEPFAVTDDRQPSIDRVVADESAALQYIRKLVLGKLKLLFLGHMLEPLARPCRGIAFRYESALGLGIGITGSYEVTQSRSYEHQRGIGK